VLLGIAAHADAEVGRRGVEQVGGEVAPAVHVGHLAHQVDGVLVGGLAVAQRLLVAALVAAHGQHVVDAQVAELDQEVLGLLAREALAEHVRHA
jgi:hypothetical protein